MDNNLIIKMSSIMIDCKNPIELAEFYASLIKWDIVFFDDEYAVISPPGMKRGTYPCISFQKNLDYVPPVFPDKPEMQQQMEHIDFIVNDLEAAVKHAVDCGADVAREQFADYWKVMLDPAGHPFCLVEHKEVIENDSFALL